MQFFIDGNMVTKEDIKRFCFGITNNGGVGESIFFAPIEANTKKTMLDLGIKNLEIFGNSSFYFVVADGRADMDVSSLKTILKEIIVRNDVGPPKAVIVDRVFKKDSQENNFTRKLDSHKRIVMTLEIKNSPALLEEYKEIHIKVWPQIIDNMDTMGIKDMEIYLLGYQAFLIMDTAADFDMKKDGERWANLPREREWQEYVAKFQKVDLKSNSIEKWKSMALIG